MWAQLVAQNTKSLAAQRVAVDEKLFEGLANNPALDAHIRDAVWAAKLPVRARSAMAHLYPDAVMGAAACAHRYHNVALAWVSNPQAQITDEVTAALRKRTKPAEVDKICVMMAEVHPEEAVAVIAQLGKEVAPRATMWMWAYEVGSASDDEVAAALAEYETWGDEYGHKYVAAVLGTRPGVAAQAHRYTHPVVVTSLAGCRHITADGCAHVSGVGDAFALMALVANPVCPAQVVEQVRDTCDNPDVVWTARGAATRARVDGTWASATGEGLERIVRRAAAKTRTWEMNELLTNPHLSAELRQVLADSVTQAPLGLRHLVPSLCDNTPMQEWPHEPDRPGGDLQVARAQYYAQAAVGVWDEMGLSEAGWRWLFSAADSFTGTVTELGVVAYGVGQA